MNPTAVVPSDYARRAIALLAEVDRRYHTLRHTLVRAGDGEDLADWQIELQRLDLASVLEVMAPDTQEED